MWSHQATGVFRLVMITLGVLGLSDLAQAQLGERSLTLQTPSQNQFISASRSVVTTAFTVHELTTRDKVELHEYVNANGYVFAYYWVGSTKPDVWMFLGGYAQRYQAAIASLSSGRSALRVNDMDFVVQTGGKMNRLWGATLLPLLAPPGFGMSDIK